jgi:hypothetical protein
MALPEKYQRQIDKIVNENLDLRTKVIGDRIIIWDFSSVTGEHSEKLCSHDFAGVPYLIVIETNRRTTLQIFNTVYVLDLVVVNPKTNIKYRVASAHVKIKDLDLKYKHTKRL